MAEANNATARSTRAHDEDSDHLTSGTSTPPTGTSTPQPDLTDKRLPGITNNTYFAQVRLQFHPTSPYSFTPAAKFHSIESPIPPAPVPMHRRCKVSVYESV